MINDKDYKIKQNISKLAKQIRMKYLDLRKGQLDEAEFLKRSYEPIVQPVQEILSKLNTAETVPFTPAFSTPKKAIKKDDEQDESFETPTQKFTDAQMMESFGDDGLYENYIKKYDSQSGEIDHEYGLKLDPVSNKWHLGESEVIIDDNDFILDDERYPATVGLYELLFMKQPDNDSITDDDIKNYRKIVKKSHLFKGDLSKNKYLYKYNLYLRPTKKRSSYQLRPKTGEGLTKILNMSRKKEFVYYDNYNELVERLQLLVGAQLAGNNSVNNEIISILEELREADIIE